MKQDDSLTSLNLSRTPETPNLTNSPTTSSGSSFGENTVQMASLTDESIYNPLVGLDVSTWSVGAPGSASWSVINDHIRVVPSSNHIPPDFNPAQLNQEPFIKDMMFPIPKLDSSGGFVSKLFGAESLSDRRAHLGLEQDDMHRLPVDMG
jgi:hypothetical protein